MNRTDPIDHGRQASGADSAHASQDPQDDPRLWAAVQEYQTEIEAGRRPDRRAFLERHPEVAGELSAVLQGLAFVNAAAAQMGESGGGTSAGAGLGPELTRALGDFQLVKEIGRGGMGVVYEAVQLSLGRRVAVKVLPLAAAMDSRHLERFRNEAQAAARLHHTNIVPVHAVGCERSVHFYAMQLIDGQSLADVIRQLRELAIPVPSGRPGRRSAGAASASPEGLEATVVAEPRNAPLDETLPIPAMPASPETSRVSIADPDDAGGTPAPSRSPMSSPPAGSATELSALRASNRAGYARSVATLGASVADALEHAHRAGIVHRDVKPANLLLDRAGTVWVTDFGLAQFYADADLTRSGDLVGTMRYMSPEQASGRAVVLDQRTDVYSLGATLFELLTLTPAVQGSTHEELLRRLANDEPPAARSLDRTIPVELDLILAKAMAREAGDRYPTARALADDLRRFLNHEPTVARPPTALNRLAKWVRRHKGLTASAAILLAVAAVALSVSTVLIAREQANTEAALTSERLRGIEARQQRARAERSAAEARAAIDFIVGVAAGMDELRDAVDARRFMLEEALDYYEGFLSDPASGPAASAELDAARATVANLLEESRAIDAAMRASSRGWMLSNRSVQDDLGLTAAEVAALPRLPVYRPYDGGAGGFEDPHASRAERYHEAVARAAEFDAAIGRAIGPDRFERLKQIQRQARGAMTFADPEVLRRLGLTREQRARLREIQAKFRRPLPPPELNGDASPRRPDDAPARRPVARDEEGRQIAAVLTPTQREAWQSILGRKFAGLVGPPRDDGDGAGAGAGGPGRRRG